MLRFLSKKYSVFSLIKLLLVFGMLLIILVAYFVFYPGVRDRSESYTEISNLSSIKANMNRLYAAQGSNYIELNNATANQARIFPETMNEGNFTATGDIRSSWGGAVSISNSLKISGNKQQLFYTIKYQNVPGGICLPLVSGAAHHFEQVIINGMAVMIDHSGRKLDAQKGGEFDPGKAAEGCTIRNTSTIEFIAR